MTSFWKLILHYLTATIMMFAAGATVLPGGDGAAGEEGGGEGGEGAEGEGTDTGGEDEAEAGEAEGVEDEDAEGEEGDGSAAAGAKEEKIDWRTVPQAVKAHLQEISKTDPKLANAIQNAVYTSQTFLKEFPNGLKEAQGLKRIIDEAGGPEEIAKVSETYKTLVEEQESLDNMAREGNVEVLDNLIEIAGDGFSKLMPSALDKWFSADPDTYGHVMGKIMVNAMQDANVVADLNLAFSMLGLKNEGATAEAMKALQRIAAWVNNVGKTAQTPPKKPQVDPKIAEQQKKIDEEKETIFREKFSGQFGSWRNREIDMQLTSLGRGKQFNAFQKKSFGDNVVQEIQNILTSDTNYMKTLDRIYASKDLAELLKFTKARTAKALPDAAKRVYRQLFTTLTPAKKPVVKPGQKPVPGQKIVPGQKVTPPPQGWVKVSPDKAPRPDEIDRDKTDFKMGFRKQAILKNGKKVYWGDKVPV
jgi:hypothetical protein